jgi:branched-chain amino acid transport system permease protein
MEAHWQLTTRTRASAALAIVALLAVLALTALPFFAGRGMVQQMFQILTFLVLAQCWNLLAGYAGLISVGQQAFVGMGAYACFVLAVYWPVPPALALLLAGAAATALAALSALFTFRLNGAYFAVGTWVVAEVVRQIAVLPAQLGGGSGMSLPAEFRDQLPGLALLRSAGFSKAHAVDLIAYWLALALCLVTIALVYRFMRTPSGLGLAAVRDNEQAARSVGVNPGRLKWLVYLGASFLTGVCGALIFFQKQRVSPDTAFSVTDWTALVIFIVVIGGIGTIEGPILGVLIFFAAQHFFADYGPVYLMMLGLVGALAILIAPKGLWGALSTRLRLSLFPTQQRLEKK